MADSLEVGIVAGVWLGGITAVVLGANVLMGNHGQTGTIQGTIRQVNERTSLDFKGDTYVNSTVVVNTQGGKTYLRTLPEISACAPNNDCQVNSPTIVQRLQEAEKTGKPVTIEVVYDWFTPALKTLEYSK